MKHKSKRLYLLLMLILFLPACNNVNEVEQIYDTSSIVIEKDAQPDSVTLPTQTAIATATTAATLNPPTTTATVISTASATSIESSSDTVLLPPSNRDLLFLADGAFKRWNHETQSIEILVAGPDPSICVHTDINDYEDFVGDIVDFSISEDGKQVVFAQLTALQPETYTPDEDFVTQHRLYFMDLGSQAIREFVPRIDNLSEFSISPDAQYVAFSGSSFAGDFEVDELGKPLSNLYLLATDGDNSDMAELVAPCTRFCSQIVWHSDSSLFLYGDLSALWMRYLAANEPEMLVQNQPEHITDEGGKDLTAIYSPLMWANNGRFVMLKRTHWEGGSRAVLDLTTKALVAVPDSMNYPGLFGVEVIWAPDDRISVLRSEMDNEQDGNLTEHMPNVELWRFLPEKSSIVQEEKHILSEQQVGAAGQQYVENGRFAYALLSWPEESNPASGLFQLDSLSAQPERINAQPYLAYAYRVLWSTDGSDVLIWGGFKNHVFYGAVGSDNIDDVTDSLGADAHAFQWQPEIMP